MGGCIKTDMKIFALPSHQSEERTSGVDFARIIQPMTHLNGYKDIETKVFTMKDKIDWLHVAKNYDVIYFNYLNNPWGFAAMGAMARKFGVKIVMDIDDDLWDLHSDNSAQSVYKKGSPELRNFELICNEVDYITCTNAYLRNVIIHNTNKKLDKIEIFPNYIDLDLYNHKSPFKNTGQIVLTHFGSTTHFLDLNNFEFQKGINKIMDEYPNVILKTVGAFIPKLRDKWGARYQNHFGDVDIYKWVKDKFPEVMDDTDIMVVPLVNDVYNRCKSDIKYLEASSAGVTGVYQKIRQYNETIEEGVDGYLADTDKEWYRSIKQLIDFPELREIVGKNAFTKIEQDKQMKNHVEEYAEFFKRIVDNNKK